MSGVDTGGGGGKGKRAVDQEVNMIPFIDLLMVTISFLLITAVWSTMARLNASAQLPSPNNKSTQVQKDKENQPSVLHVRVSDKTKKFKLEWQTGTKFEDIGEVDMTLDTSGGGGGYYSKLAEAIVNAYASNPDDCKKSWSKCIPTHNLYGTDVAWESSQADDHGAKALNQAILHVDNAFQFSDVVKVMDAIYTPRRFICFAGKPDCCGLPDAQGHSPEGCKTAAMNTPAFNVAFSSGGAT